MIIVGGAFFSHSDGVSATEGIPGCMDEEALNFNSLATVDDDSCEYPEVPQEPFLGCTDDSATNFNIEANQDDGSCVYEVIKESEPQEEPRSRRSGRRRHPSVGEVLGVSTSSSTSCEMYLNSYMRIGQENPADEVRKLQAFLNEQGHLVAVDGFFGSSTEIAVKAFQKAHASEILAPWGITEPTGYVFKMTRYVMNNMVCAGSEVKPTL